VQEDGRRSRAGGRDVGGDGGQTWAWAAVVGETESARGTAAIYIYIYSQRYSIPWVWNNIIPYPSRSLRTRRARSALVPLLFLLRSPCTPRSTHGPATFFCIICHLSVRHNHFFWLLDSTLTGRQADAPCDSSFSCAPSINIAVC
jgi:hypothetical protein